MEKATENIEVFEIDDDFDPLEDTGLELDEEVEYTGMDYQVPIPDADRSIVPDPVILPPEERIAKLIHGLPGQKFRLLTAITICKEPKTLEEASAELEEKYPQGTSVYTPMRIIELLCDAGALDRIDPEEPEGEGEGAQGESEGVGEGEGTPAAPVAAASVAAAPEDAVAPEDVTALDDADEERIDSLEFDMDDLEFDDVEQVEPSLYVATEVGLKEVEERWSASVAAKVITDEPQYLSIWKKILTMCDTEGGQTKVAIAAEIDNDPLLQEPRRWCQYFIEKLREGNALEWHDAWVITDIGKEILGSDIFAEASED